jgi:hypothetical protein
MRIYGEMNIKGLDTKILYFFDSERNYRMFTNTLKYGDEYEIMFSNNAGCYIIKDLNKFRLEWNKIHPDEVIEDKSLKDFMEVKI